MARVPPWRRPGGRLPPHPEMSRILRQARAKLGWSQRRVAAAAGISQPYLCQLEGGSRAPLPRTVARLGSFNGVPIPLPLIDVALTANGRREAGRRAREELAERARGAAVPVLVATWEPPPLTWQMDPRRERYVPQHRPVDDARRR